MFRRGLKLNLRSTIFQNKHQTFYYSTKLKINSDLLQFFQHTFDLPENKIKLFFKKYPSFYKNSVPTLSENASLLINYGISKEDITNKIQLLTFHPLTIKNYLMLLEEGGIIKSKIDAQALLRYKNISKRSIVSLKYEQYIYNDVDVQHHILSFLQFPKKLYPKKCDESLAWGEVVENTFRLYVGWKIKMDFQNLNQAQTVYHRLKNKSFRLMEKSIDILLQELQFSEEKIRRNIYLVHSDTDNTLAILNNFKSLCGMDARILLKKHPKVLLTPWKTIQQIQKHFEDFGIPESKLAKAPEIYTLGSNTIYERLCKLKETPELASYMNHPQVAKLVYYLTKVNLRLKYLQSKNCISLNLLASNNYSFNRFNCNGNDKVKTNDIMVYLTNELGEDKITLRELLERHSFWQYISLLTIRNTYEFLKNKNFTKNQIRHCIHILLYPINKIEKELLTTHNMKGISYLRNSSGLIKSEFILPLVLYNLEKKYHFSGNGVWSTDEKHHKVLKHGPLKDTEELDHMPSTMLF